MRWIAILLLFTGCALERPTVKIVHRVQDNQTSIEVEFK